MQKEAETTAEELGRRLAQHYIDYDALKADDFDRYFEARQRRLLELIAAAMGKAVVEPSVPSLPEEYDLDDEEPIDEDVVESAA